MELEGYPENRILFVPDWNSPEGDHEVVALSEQHRSLLQRLWEDPKLSGQVGTLLMESTDINQRHLGQRFIKISERL